MNIIAKLSITLLMSLCICLSAFAAETKGYIITKPAPIVFKYECDEFNDLHIGIHCSYDKSSGFVLKLDGKVNAEDEKVKYWINKMILKYGSYGGKMFKVVNPQWGENIEASCQYSSQHSNYSCVYCETPYTVCGVNGSNAQELKSQ